MNAQEARNKALQNADNEIVQIQNLIEVRVRGGYTTLELTFPIKEGSCEWLKQNGYQYHYFNFVRIGTASTSSTRIMW